MTATNPEATATLRAGPWEMQDKFDLLTSDFTYVRWLGDRKGIEERSTASRFCSIAETSSALKGCSFCGFRFELGSDHVGRTQLRKAVYR